MDPRLPQANLELAFSISQFETGLGGYSIELIPRLDADIYRTCKSRKLGSSRKFSFEF
jgi:hypothetical protein